MSFKHCNIYHLALHFSKAMAEMMAENYHNIWAKKKKIELEAKGNINYIHNILSSLWLV